MKFQEDKKKPGISLQRWPFLLACGVFGFIGSIVQIIPPEIQDVVSLKVLVCQFLEGACRERLFLRFRIQCL